VLPPAGLRTVVLVHGGLWEDMDAERFWVRPGVVGALEARGVPVLAPDRVVHPRSWAEEVAHLLPLLPDEPVTLVGGSNGCSVAARVAVEHPDRVGRLVLAWPASAGNTEVDTLYLAAGVPPELLAGETLRGLSDVELAELRLPVAVLPGPADRYHERSTVDTLLALLAGAVELPPSPEPPRPGFAPYAAAVAAALLG
jgi:pimeloyl-ACP methyl ester carboxylesterase